MLNDQEVCADRQYTVVVYWNEIAVEVTVQLAALDDHEHPDSAGYITLLLDGIAAESVALMGKDTVAAEARSRLCFPLAAVQRLLNVSFHILW